MVAVACLEFVLCHADVCFFVCLVVLCCDCCLVNQVSHYKHCPLSGHAFILFPTDAFLSRC